MTLVTYCFVLCRFTHILNPGSRHMPNIWSLSCPMCAMVTFVYRSLSLFIVISENLSEFIDRLQISRAWGILSWWGESQVSPGLADLDLVMVGMKTADGGGGDLGGGGDRGYRMGRVCPRCRYLGFSHNAIGPPHLTAFATKWHFENNVFNNTRYMSIDNIFSAH